MALTEHGRAREQGDWSKAVAGWHDQAWLRERRCVATGGGSAARTSTRQPQPANVAARWQAGLQKEQGWERRVVPNKFCGAHSPVKARVTKTVRDLWGDAVRKCEELWSSAVRNT